MGAGATALKQEIFKRNKTKACGNSHDVFSDVISDFLNYISDEELEMLIDDPDCDLCRATVLRMKKLERPYNPSEQTIVRLSRYLNLSWVAEQVKIRKAYQNQPKE